MEREHYPALKGQPHLVYLDASNAFPLHEKIITHVTDLMSHVIGSPGKAGYAGAVMVTKAVETARENIASFIGAKPEDIYFVSGATEAARLVAEAWCGANAIVAYSPEDHLATLRALATIPPERLRPLYYNELGDLHGSADDASIYFLTQAHPIYGTDITPAQVRGNNTSARLVVDASQAIARMKVNVNDLPADALYFSGHKCGALPGAGVLYIARAYREEFCQHFYAPSLPWQAISSIGVALDIFQEKPISERSFYLTKLTSYLVEQLETIPDLTFSKGVAQSLHLCTGNGIVSFRLAGLSSYDVMLLLDDEHISVRGGDHCVSPEAASQDFVRVSMQAYTTRSDVDTLVEALRRLA